MQTAPESINITKAKDEFLFSENGDKIIDGISSWWVNLFGHCHPHIAQKLQEQTKALEQVIFSGFHHPKAEELCDKLSEFLPKNQTKFFFTDNGSTAVEAALKMCLQYFINIEAPRNKILALDGAYHGDTFGAMSVSERGAFTEPFHRLLFDVTFLPFPNTSKNETALLEKLDSLDTSEYAAIIVEPLIQGSAGMRMYSKEMLEKIFAFCKSKGILIIADEVFTGFGRTGKVFATDYVKTKPDIYCLSKGITGGFLPMGMTTTTEEIYNAFLSDTKTKMLFHGHSYTGNALSCAAACASMDLMKDTETTVNIKRIVSAHSIFLESLKKYKKVEWARQLGTILAFELKTEETSGYLNSKRDEIYNFFISKNILLRPLGNTIYFLPPYCISDESLKKVYTAITQLINQ